LLWRVADNGGGRMLESPQDESVVRWGNEGDSFVVLEVHDGDDGAWNTAY